MSAQGTKLLTTLAAFLLATTLSHAQFTAAPGSPFSLGSAPRSIALGDFNNDGKLDLAAANSAGNTVTVLLGNGSGGFIAAPGSPFAVGTNPQSLAAADFNGDGKLDLVIANNSDNTVTVMLGDGAGHFTAAAGSPIAVGASPTFVAAADFNGDNKTDIVTANSGDNTLTVLLGNGAGRFTLAPAGPVTLGTSPQSLAIGDINRDGNQDLVTANAAGNTVSVLLGDGTGAFTAASGSPMPVGSSPLAVALADTNGDGFLDILAANSGDNTVSELLGDGAGAFTVAPGSPFAVGLKPSSLAVADINGDGSLDLVTANFNTNNVTLLLGNGAGGFTAAAASPFSAGAGPYSLAIGDFNGDGKPDVAAANLTGGSLSLLLDWLPAISANPASLTVYAVAGHPAAAALPVTVTSAPAGPAYTVATNQSWLTPTPASNSTGGVTTVHLAANATSLTPGVYSATARYKAANYFGSATAVTLNAANPSGTLQTAAGSPFTTGASPQSLAAADFNGDGKPDLAIANYAANSVTVLLGDGAGGFTEAAGSPFAVGAGPASVAIGDFNGDGKTDIVTANSGSNNVTLLLGSGTGNFIAAAGSPFAVGTEPLSLAVADVNGDGKTDLITANTGADNISVLLGNGSGGFVPAPGSPLPAGISPGMAAIGDLNGDGKPDLVTANSGNIVLVFLGNGSGGFSYSGFLSVGSFPQSVSLQDVNGDGKPDLVTANFGDNTVTVFLGNGSGGFTPAPASPFTVGTSPQSATVADFNGDGNPDIAVANVGDKTVTVLLGNGTGGFAAAPGSPFPAGATPSALAAADFNGDGRLDLAIANTAANAVSLLLGAAVNTSSILATSAVSPITHGSAVPLTLAVTQGAGNFNGSAPTGTATFLDGATVLGTAAQTASPFTFLAAALADGTHIFTAVYNGDPANASSAGGPLSITVLAQPQTIAFAPLGNKPFSAVPFTVNATATSGLPPVFTSTTPPVCTVAGSSVAFASVGACTIQASQPGNPSFAAAMPVSQTFQVTQAAQTIAFSTLPSVAIGTAPFNLSATASSGLLVTYSSTTSAVCTLSGSAVTLVSIGACVIQASQPGNPNYAAAAGVNQTFQVTQAGQTIAFAAIPNAVIGAAPVPLTASSSSGLPVNFASATAPVCTVSGSTATLVATGNCIVNAAQAGNTSYAAAAPVSQTFSVAPSGQTISFAGLSAQPLGTKPFAVSATASSGLAVTFASTTTSVCTVSGTNVTLVSAGSCTIKASQAGNNSYAAAPSVTQTFTVSPQAQTIAFAALNNKPFGSPSFTVTAKATSNLAVAFASTTSPVCTVTGASVTLVTAGSCTIEASQAGNASYSAATPVDQTFTVSPAAQTIAFAALKNVVFGAPPFTLIATATSGLPVSFLSGNSAICTVSGTTVIPLIGGTCTIQASQAGDVDYTAATLLNQSFQVTPAAQTIAFSTLSNQVLGTPAFTIGATASSGYPVSFSSSSAAVCTVSGATVTLVATGSCKIQASQGGDSNYAPATPVVQTFTVGPGAVAIGSVLNAGSYDPGQIPASGFAVAFGFNFSTTTAQASSLKFPGTLGGATLTITDSAGSVQPAQLYYVSPTQINFIVPSGLASGPATVTVTGSAGGQSAFPTAIAQVAPSLFTADSSGKGVPAAIAQAYAPGASPKLLPVFNCKTAPAVCTPAPIDLGAASSTVYLELYGTGIKGRSSLSGVSATLGGVPLNVTYAGPQGTYPGLDQVNVVLNRSLIGQGQLTLQLTADGQAANPVLISIK